LVFSNFQKNMQDDSKSVPLTDELGKSMFYQSYRAIEQERSYFPRTHCAYIDDSGSHTQGEVFVMAGLVAGWSEWAKFSEEWREVLEEKPRLFQIERGAAPRRAVWSPESETA
jgi:hypothetical protein